MYISSVYPRHYSGRLICLLLLSSNTAVARRYRRGVQALFIELALKDTINKHQIIDTSRSLAARIYKCSVIHSKRYLSPPARIASPAPAFHERSGWGIHNALGKRKYTLRTRHIG